MYDTIYRCARERVFALARTLSPDQLGVRVSATPKWTVHELIAHVVGVASDGTSGRMDGAISDAWTERQVSERRGRELDELLAEWESLAPAADAQLARTTRIPNMAFDLVCHESDLREALSLPRAERPGWEPLLDVMAGALGSQLDLPGLLEIRDETGSTWSFGSGEPTTRLRIDGYEIVRAVFSRRSLRQIADWDWDPAPIGNLAKVGVFGSRKDDQPIPTA
ncbi:MAG TPA: maleylpyruvate isomerase family mycothiol-dependent enzyme [Pseudonocardiaceae bacterium]